METAVRGTEILSVNSLIVVRIIVLYANRCVTHVIVGVEPCSCTNNRIDSVANGIVHRQIYHQVVIATVRSTVTLGIYTLHIVRWIVDSAHRGITKMAVGVETLSGTDYGRHRIAQRVVHC